MSFQPQSGDTIIIQDIEYRFGEHPAAPGLVYAQAGRQGVIYQLLPTRGDAVEAKALKVFHPKYRIPAMVYQSELLDTYSELPGLSVCSRNVLTPEKNGGLIQKSTDLLYAVVMPWIHGPTWLDIVAEHNRLTRQDSLQIAKSLARVCSGMEQRGLAHCDLSAPNVMLPFFSEVKQSSKASSIELVDVEQLYSPKMDRPDVLFSGSPGYAAHRALLTGMWSAYADRFAGSILLAEMLGWSSQQIVDKAWGESYFDQREMQTSCERYEGLKHVLTERYGGKVSDLFSRAWESQDLSSCPTFGEWLIVLNGVAEEEQIVIDVKQQNAPEGTQAIHEQRSEDKAIDKEAEGYTENSAVQPDAVSVPLIPARADVDPDVVNRLFRQARELEEQNQLQSALEVYRSAHHFVEKESPMHIELAAAIQDLEQKLARVADQMPRSKVKLGKRAIAIISVASALLLLGCGAFVVNQMNEDAVKKAAEERALLDAKTQQLKAEEERKQEEAKRVREEEQLKEEARKQEEQQRKEDEQKRIEEQQRIKKLEEQKKKDAERKRLQAQYDQQEQYEKYVEWKKKRDEQLKIEQAREQERKRLEAAQAAQAAEKAAQLKKVRNRDVVLLIASYNKAYNALSRNNMKNASKYALEFTERYEKDPDYFKNVGKVGTRAGHIYKFLNDTSYQLPDI
ncbi:membrane protein [Paenibacillus sp. UNC217MF]|uniref:membrane protein n=1 Tax=Paenibacillus sp. UNC217MF TaxID=1449062 RepID=UPI00048EDD39|nr:membrane protein [Paenibacillus sp. UNC217MF]